jgi:hypothetical protein
VPLCPPQSPHDLTWNAGCLDGKPVTNRLCYGIPCLHATCLAYSLTLKLKTVCSTKIEVDFCRTRWHHIPEYFAFLSYVFIYLCVLFGQNLKAQGVRCSVIALAAEVHICHKLCRETGGLFAVILDDCHFRDQLFQHIDPPPAATFLDSSLIKMGFPHHLMQEGKEAPLTLCMW